MDLSLLSVADLRNLRAKIDTELVQREAQEKVKAREEIARIMQAAGLSMNDLTKAGSLKFNKGGAGKPVEAKYVDPNDASRKWTGRGRQPKWVKEWVDSGKSLDELRI